MKVSLFILALSLLFFAVVTDIRAREIPDWISVVFLLMGLVRLPYHGWGALVGACVIFSCAFGLWLAGFMGGGDVKLIASSSLLFPPLWQIQYILDIAVMGGVLAVLYLVLRKVVSVPATPLYGRTLRIECWRIRRGFALPYAVAIAAGFVVAALQGGFL
ncbi:prepilin peptidase [Acetobacter sp. LMG 32666]|uniref:A24 family peptidase n=1 Tax=Acetobacter sp. LMG 32666 TaxID=2959295 RepID=UPI0030C7EEB2